MQYKPFGERSILIEWPHDISEKTLKSILFYKKELEKYYIKHEVYIKSAYNSILVTYDKAINNFYDEILTLKSIYFDDFEGIVNDSRLWKIPVCYDLEFGLDLEEIAFKDPTFEVTLSADSTKKGNGKGIQTLFGDILSRANVKRFSIQNGSVKIKEKLRVFSLLEKPVTLVTYVVK